eukprot:scaffold7123_cov119-Isochrysis_galbana.AAC.8
MYWWPSSRVDGSALGARMSTLKRCGCLSQFTTSSGIVHNDLHGTVLSTVLASCGAPAVPLSMYMSAEPSGRGKKTLPSCVSPSGVITMGQYVMSYASDCPAATSSASGPLHDSFCTMGFIRHRDCDGFLMVMDFFDGSRTRVENASSSI